MEEKPNYFVIIPPEVRYDVRLKDKAKLLYGEILALSNKKGYCYANNNYFAKLYGVSTTTISLLIKELVDAGHITSVLIYKEGTKEILNRYLRILKEGYLRNLKEGIKENLKDNNTSINNININKVSKKEVKSYEEILSDFSLSERLTNCIMDFIQMRKFIKKPLTNRGLELMINKLRKMTPDEDKQIKILEQSIMNNWQDIFELKENEVETDDDRYEIVRQKLEREGKL